jgi:type VI protein secretion system component VasF
MTEQTAPSSRRLESERIRAGIETLVLRIRERFPSASLAHVAQDLQVIASEHAARIERIARPHLPLRLLVAVIVALAIGLLVYVVRLIDFSKTNADSVYSVLQGIEATFNIVVLGGAALIFLVTAERRVAERRALRALSELRSIVHVIDMHQLTKDPSYLLGDGKPTANSPQRTMTPFELTRYLDYCSELLAMTGKVAALYAQHVPDAVVVEAVSDLERLTSALSQKVWQKIAIVHASQNAHASHGAHEQRRL